MRFEDVRADDIIKVEYPSGDFKQFKVNRVNTLAKRIYSADFEVHQFDIEDGRLKIELIHREQIPLPTKRFALIVPNESETMTGIWLNSSGEWLNDSGTRVTDEQAHEWLNSGEYKVVYEGDFELDATLIEW